MTFFSPPVLTYSYNHPRTLVIAKITEVFKKEVTFFTFNDMTGRFLSKDTFAICLGSLFVLKEFGYGSILTGQIIETDKGVTEIRTKARPSMMLYLVFFISLIFGLLYFYKFTQTGLVEWLFWSLALIVLGSALIIGFSNVAISSIRERYKMYIDKELKTGHTAANMGLA